MFLVGDVIANRHAYVERFFDKEDASVAILLAAADFERCAKRGILALGKSSTKDIRKFIFNSRFHGLEDFKRAWRIEVMPHHKVKLADGVVTRWSEFVRAYRYRHSLIHGVPGRMTPAFATKMARRILVASSEIHTFAANQGKDLDTRIVRR